MNTDNSEEDDIRPEYDLASMQVRRMGKDRKSFAGHMVRLEDDVAEMFPSAEAVNDALRLVMRIIQQNQKLALSSEEAARRVAAFESFVKQKHLLWDCLTPDEKIESDEQFEELYKSLAESRE
jgi:hypothetical protein